MFKKLYENFLSFMKENWSFLLSVVVIILVFFVIKLPYDVEMPGGIINLDNRVTIDGDVFETKGSFNMAYVKMVEGSIPHILVGLILPDWDVSPSSDRATDSETVEDADNRGLLYLEQSKKNALVAGLEQAKQNYEMSNMSINILYVLSDADTDLRVGDKILSIDDINVTQNTDIVEYIQTCNVGDTINIKVLRDSKEVLAHAKIYENEEKTKVIGIASVLLFDVKSDLDIEIKSKSTESGPSGGLMMSLMVYSAASGKDLTKGRKIVGTGTIDTEGNVGSVGGIKHKLMGAVRNKADVFLVPADNYEEACEVKKDKKYNIELVKVDTLEDAINYLEG